MTPQPDTDTHPLDNPRGDLRPSRGREMVTVDPYPLDFAMRLTATSNAELANATGVSREYVSKIRNGVFRRANRNWLGAAAEYLAGQWRNPAVLVTAMVKDK